MMIGSLYRKGIGFVRADEELHVALETHNPYVQIDNISHAYNGGRTGTPVLQDLTFTIAEGEFVCLLGRSGCGKSTLLNILAGFLTPTAGHCFLNGRPIIGPGPDRCVVFQDDALFPWLTVRENIGFGLRDKKMAKKVREKEVDRYLELVELRGYENFLPRELSGGMKQRVALARVLILSPLLLLMDEPFGALDAQTRENMQKLLLHLQQERRQTILFITHDVREAVTLADRVLFLTGGANPSCKEMLVPLDRPRDADDEKFLTCCAGLQVWLREAEG
jgi:NitT/TauT family transport system ATP-binding protein